MNDHCFAVFVTRLKYASLQFGKNYYIDTNGVGNGGKSYSFEKNSCRSDRQRVTFRRQDFKEAI